MSRLKLKLAVSDFHMGAGPLLSNGHHNHLEDFLYDQRFAEFLEYYCAEDYFKAEVELVICGDFFNHLQVDPMEVRPEFLTERVGLARTGAIMDGHPKVFEALKKFAAAPNHKITFLIGNHDLGLFWPTVQKFILDRIGNTAGIHLKPQYVIDGVCFEHGSQHMAENWIDFDNPFVTNGQSEPIVNLTFGDLFAVRFLYRVKKERPYIGRVFPFRPYLWWALTHDTLFALRAIANGFAYFLGVLFRIGENRRFYTRQTVKIIKEFTYPLQMDRAAKEVLSSHPECQIAIFGHGHRCASTQFGDGRWYFNTGIWNEMTSLDLGSMGRSLRFTFVEMRYDKNDTPNGQLKEWKGRYREVEDMVGV